MTAGYSSGREGGKEAEIYGQTDRQSETEPVIQRKTDTGRDTKTERDRGEERKGVIMCVFEDRI